jgi:hypothetical protein
MAHMKHFLLTGFVLLIVFIADAQTYSVTGTVLEGPTKKPLVGATVRLMSTTDSLFRSSTVSDSSGSFSFTNLNKDSFVLSISSVGFNTITRGVRIDSTNISMDIAAVPGTSTDLETVVIRTAITPVRQKGDTLEINASQFKVNPDASAEDLARKVPGITIQNGQVQAQGENVRRVTIDGRELFGDDATAALRNLPAEVIDKIQIFDRLSDQAQFTGFDDGNTSKEINIVTKANMRNGQFGRVYAGYGSDNRYQAGGNATFLHDDRRISLVGLTNNINQQNFSSQDLLGVTSNAQRGGGNRGGGQPGNRGGGGGPQRGGGGPGGGGFGNNSNFLVGQQPGINRTNAFGINYSDLWNKKVTVSGSYFFNNSNNTTSEDVSRQYLLEGIPNLRETTDAVSRNNNHRFNMRLEYRIDSANQLIITPSLSFQDNRSDRNVTTTSFFSPNDMVAQTNNITTNTRTGNNLNNSILFRHSFPKRGRSFSVNLNTSSNSRAGDNYRTTYNTSYDSVEIRDTTKQFTDQFNNGHQVSANLVYTEPLGKNSQLQFNYNPTYSKSKADQEAFRYDNAGGKYSIFDTAQSSRFANVFKAQNAGLSYRYGNRDNQISFGLNYQHSSLNSDQEFPRALTVDKSFSNLLPNAMVRYKISTRSNIRFNYRANTNQPSVTQLQDVYDLTNAPYITSGNPNLEQQFTHILSSRYTYTNTTKGLLFVGNVFMQKADNYITNATFVPRNGDSVINRVLTLRPGQQLTMPVNLDGYMSLRSFITFAVPLKFIKSNFNLNGGVSYSKLPGIINNIESESRNTTYTLGTVIGSNVSEFVDFTVSYAANFSDVKNNVNKAQDNKYFSHQAGLQLNLLSKKGWFFQNDLNNQLYSGLTEGFNQSYFLWNMSAGKKLLKSKQAEVRLSVFDLLGQNRSLARNVTETYIEDERNQVLQRYFMLTFSYNLRNFGAPAPRGRQ